MTLPSSNKNTHVWLCDNIWVNGLLVMTKSSILNFPWKTPDQPACLTAIFVRGLSNVNAYIHLLDPMLMVKRKTSENIQSNHLWISLTYIHISFVFLMFKPSQNLTFHKLIPFFSWPTVVPFPMAVFRRLRHPPEELHGFAPALALLATTHGLAQRYWESTCETRLAVEH